MFFIIGHWLSHEIFVDVVKHEPINVEKNNDLENIPPKIIIHCDPISSSRGRPVFTYTGMKKAR